MKSSNQTWRPSIVAALEVILRDVCKKKTKKTQSAEYQTEHIMLHHHHTTMNNSSLVFQASEVGCIRYLAAARGRSKDKFMRINQEAKMNLERGQRKNLST